MLESRDEFKHSKTLVIQILSYKFNQLFYFYIIYLETHMNSSIRIKPIFYLEFEEIK